MLRMGPKMSQRVVRTTMCLAFALLLPSCYGARIDPNPVGRGQLAVNFYSAQSGDQVRTGNRSAVTIGERALGDRAAVPVWGFREPGDWGHRNYCGAGATQVLLSAWLPQVPDIETVARRAKLNPNSGQTGVDTAAAINSFIDPVVVPALGHSWYRGDHVTTLSEVVAKLRSDLVSREATGQFGHSVPVMVQTMTRTMPGWNRWNATHMITIYGFDLSHNDPAVDTVSYAETPSPLAGYRGPAFQTISLQALWTAMQAYITESPSDPTNIIW